MLSALYDTAAKSALYDTAARSALYGTAARSALFRIVKNLSHSSRNSTITYSFSAANAPQVIGKSVTPQKAVRKTSGATTTDAAALAGCVVEILLSASDTARAPLLAAIRRSEATDASGVKRRVNLPTAFAFQSTCVPMAQSAYIIPSAYNPNVHKDSGRHNHAP